MLVTVLLKVPATEIPKILLDLPSLSVRTRALNHSMRDKLVSTHRSLTIIAELVQ